MKFKYLVAVLMILLTAAVLSVPTGLIAQKSDYTPDKELCARMIAAGKQYYERGKYLDAKNFFRKAVEADPRSMKAWLYYDQVVVFALAEKVEKQNDLLIPDTSIRSEVGQATSSQTPVNVAPIELAKPESDTGSFRPVVEEGC